jgi:oligopeptide/dipeptide ABC transporter ATP-binding protein
VMYSGEIVETGPAPDLFAAPSHPYTRGLLRALPRLDGVRGPLAAIPGQVPDPRETLPGCSFAPRCTEALDRCATEKPPEFLAGPGTARCWLVDPEA